MRYKFIGRDGTGTRYVWQSIEQLPNDSRVVELSCPIDWFWNPNRKRAA